MNMWQEFKNVRLLHSNSICEKQHQHTQKIKKNDGVGAWAALHPQEFGFTTGKLQHVAYGFLISKASKIPVIISNNNLNKKK